MPRRSAPRNDTAETEDGGSPSSGPAGHLPPKGEGFIRGETQRLGVKGALAAERGQLAGISGQNETAPEGGGKMSRVVEPGADWKAEQLRIIQENNPMEDDVHTGVRSVEDIKSFREALNDPEWDYDDFAPDYTRKVAERALQEGTIRVYSSEEIKEGTFVTPSRLEAESYAGGKQVNMKRVRLENVAWIDPMEGQYTGAATRSAAERVTKGRTFSYAELIAKGPLQGSVVPHSVVSNLFKPDGTVDTGWLVKHVFAQCQTVQTNASEPTHFVSVADLGRNVEVTDDGVLHGIKRDNTVKKSGNLRPTTNDNA